MYTMTVKLSTHCHPVQGMYRIHSQGEKELDTHKKNWTPIEIPIHFIWLNLWVSQTLCQHGYSVRYFRTSRLLEAMTISHGDGSYSKLLQQLAKVNLLILDDWGLEPLTLSQRNDLLEIMDDRHNQSSTIVTSQIPVSKWHDSIGDATLADAILDRLIHNAHRLELKGKSMRKNQAKTGGS
nr:ATP-binding protein [Endozoicomonas sp.]